MRDHLDAPERGGLLLGQLVPAREVARVVVAHEDAGVVGLPDQQFERQVEREERVLEHERRPGPGTPEDHELRVGHGETDLGGLTAVVDHREDLETSGFELRDGPTQHLVDTDRTSQGDDTGGGRFHTPTLKEAGGSSNPATP